MTAPSSIPTKNGMVMLKSSDQGGMLSTTFSNASYAIYYKVLGLIPSQLEFSKQTNCVAYLVDVGEKYVCVRMRLIDFTPGRGSED